MRDLIAILTCTTIPPAIITSNVYKDTTKDKLSALAVIVRVVKVAVAGVVVAAVAHITIAGPILTVVISGRVIGTPGNASRPSGDVAQDS